jgi:hypothetical protein
MQFKRILCPVDFADFSVNAYEYALTAPNTTICRLHWSDQ